MAALSLAAIIIQKFIRGYLTRKHKHELLKYTQEKSKQKLVVNKKAYKTVQSLRSKFLSSKVYSKHKDESEAYKSFCASKIAATFKMCLTKKLFKFHRFSVFHIASLQIQHSWKRHLARHPKQTKEGASAHRIQM